MHTRQRFELQITIPKQIAEEYGIAPGDEVELVLAGARRRRCCGYPGVAGIGPKTATAVLLGVTGFTFAMLAHAQAPLRVLSSNGVKAVIEDLQPDIERNIGRPLSIEFSTAASLAREIETGTPFDVAILTPALLERLIEIERVAAASYVELARAGVGVGARPNTGTRDVASPAALRRTLLAAESVAFTAGGQSRAAIDAAFEQLGIGTAVRSGNRRFDRNYADSQRASCLQHSVPRARRAMRSLHAGRLARREGSGTSSTSKCLRTLAPDQLVVIGVSPDT